MKKRIGILLFIILSGGGGLFQHLLAQNQHLIDSLQTQLKKLEQERKELRNNTLSIRDSSTVKILNSLCQAQIDNNPNQAMDYAKQSLAVSEQIAWKKGAAYAYNHIGNIFQGEGSYPEALKNHFASLKIKIEIGDKKGITDSYSNIGTVYASWGNYPDALKNYLASVKICEEIGDNIGVVAEYNNIGLVYFAQGNYTEALKKYFAALKINKATGNKNWMAINYGNIGLVYSAQGNYSEALKNFSIALEILQESGNRRGIAGAYINIGGVHYKLGNYPDALKNLFTALKIFEEIGAKRGIAICYNTIGLSYTQLNDLQKGKNWLQKGLALSKEINGKEYIKDAYAGIAAVDSASGDFKSAFENYKMHIIYKDSLFNEENTKKLTQAEMQYAFDKKEKQQIIVYAISSGLVLMLLLVLLILRGYREKHKANIALASKNDFIAQQKFLVEEKHKEITDSINYAERIQRSFLASKDQLNQNFGGEDNYFVLFKPKDVVSGDFYWASKLTSGLFAMVTADSTGHGVPGAIMSILNIACLNEAVKEGHTSPATILNRARQEIISVLQRDGSVEGGKDGMDCSLLVYDFKNKKLTIAAANSPVWIVRSSIGSVAKEVIEIKPDKMPVGKHDKQHISFMQQEIDLQSGDIIYTLTDGFPDQFGGPNGKKFKTKNLRELLVANSHLPMQDQKQLLETTFVSWAGDLEQVDDVTLIGVKV